MRAAVLVQQNRDLEIQECPKPSPKPDELLVKVSACGVCRTDLHIQDGDLKKPKLPLILGHEIVGTIEEIGSKVTRFQKNQRVGIPWLHQSCAQCEFCKEGKENLCDHAIFTGYLAPGGFAEYTTCPQDFAIPLQIDLPDEQIAPLLCAGLIGYRAYRKASPKESLGLYGFGAAAHLITQIALHEEKKVYAFTREEDFQTQAFAKKLGATWAGSSQKAPPTALDAVIHFAPVGDLVPLSLKALKKGGRCICAGIHMSDIPRFPYRDLWGEKRIESVANLTREDGKLFFEKLSQIQVHPSIQTYPLEDVNQALADLRSGNIQGAAVITMKRNA